MNSYSIFKSNTVVNNQQEIIKVCDYARELLANEFNKAPNTTWIYNQYNIFSYTSSSILFYDLFKDLSKSIREYVGDDRRIWFQSWLNYLTYDEVENVLGMHGHHWDIHGYISIDPKHTITDFGKFAINNEVGNIYIGPCTDEYRHKVCNTNKWEGNRITIGFDCTFDSDIVFASNNKMFPIL